MVDENPPEQIAHASDVARCRLWFRDDLAHMLEVIRHGNRRFVGSANHRGSLDIGKRHASSQKETGVSERADQAPERCPVATAWVKAERGQTAKTDG
jgi:hypothetical protein